MATTSEDLLPKSARDHIATLALSIYQIHGLPAPSPDELGGIVLRTEAGMSPDQLRHPEKITAPAIAEINQQVLRAMEAKARPANRYSAEGARQAPGDGEKGAKRALIDPLNRSPSSIRYHDMTVEGRYSGQNAPASSSGALSLPAGFARAYAGSGVGGETLRTFAAVGLDRGTFDQFRHEGFSTAQIADNAKDMKVLGGHGREDLTIGQHAPTDLRKAAVAVDQEKDPAKKAQKPSRPLSQA